MTKANANAAANAQEQQAAQQQILRDLLALGKKNGRLTLKEISDALSHLELSSEDIDKVYETLETMGIEVETNGVLEKVIGDDDDSFEPEEVEEVPEEELVDTSAMAETFAIDDPVRMYLKEIGKVDLLSPEEEVTLAERMQKGNEAAERIANEGDAIPAEERAQLEKDIKLGDRAKKRLADFPNYLIHRAEQLENLYIFTNTEGTPENIRKFHPNLIVSSTGSAPLLPPIRGLHDRIDKEGSKVASILGMINHINDYPEDMTGKKVVVVGGGAVGLDVVEFFAARNAEISIVEMMDQIGRDLDPVTKNDMKDQMKKHHVAQLTKTALQEVKDSSFLVKDAEGERELPFDYGFVCLGMKAQGQLFAELSDAFVSDDVEILNIGDSKRARRIIDGTLEGRNILNTLTQMGYL